MSTKPRVGLALVAMMGFSTASPSALGQAEATKAADPPAPTEPQAPEPKEANEGKEAQEAKERIKRWQWEFWNEGRPVHPPMKEAPSPDSANAAARYAWLLQGLDRKFADDCGWLDHRMTFEILENDAGITLAPIREGLVERQGWIDAVVEAARLERCDFGSSTNTGGVLDPNDASRPSLRDFRRARDVVDADARRLAAMGAMDGASQRLAAMIRMSWHISRRDPSLLTLLSAASTLRKASELTTKLAPELDDASRAAVLVELRRLPGLDPLGHHLRWSTARSSEISFAKSHLKDKGIGQPLRKSLVQMKHTEAIVQGIFESMVQEAVDREPSRAEFSRLILEKLGTVDLPAPDALRAILERSEELGEELSDRWYQADANEAFEAATREIDADASGLMSLVLFQPKATRRDCRATLDAVQQAIEALKKAK